MRCMRKPLRATTSKHGGGAGVTQRHGFYRNAPENRKRRPETDETGWMMMAMVRSDCQNIVEARGGGDEKMMVWQA